MDRDELVFTTRLGTGMDAANVRRDLRRALALVPGLYPADWTPRELRHSFVSLLPDAGVPLGDIAQLAATAAPPSPNGLPASDPARHPNRRNGHGSTLRTRRHRCVVTQLVTHRCGCSGRLKPLSRHGGRYWVRK